MKIDRFDINQPIFYYINYAIANIDYIIRKGQLMSNKGWF